MATHLVNIENDQEIKQRLEAERARLRKIAGLDQQIGRASCRERVLMSV